METTLELLKKASEQLQGLQLLLGSLAEKEIAAKDQMEEFKRFAEEYRLASNTVSRMRHDLFAQLVVSASRIHRTDMAYVLEKGFSCRPLPNGSIDITYALSSRKPHNCTPSTFIYNHGVAQCEKFCERMLNDIKRFLSTAPQELAERSGLVQELQEKILALAKIQPNDPVKNLQLRKS